MIEITPEGFDRDAARAELTRLAPAAAARAKGGCTVPEAWGRASVDFPELKVARALVSLVLALPFGTGGVERAFRIIPYREAHHRAHMLSSTLENVFLATQAPLAADFSKKVRGKGGAYVLKPQGLSA